MQGLTYQLARRKNTNAPTRGASVADRKILAGSGRGTSATRNSAPVAQNVKTTVRHPGLPRKMEAETGLAQSKRLHLATRPTATRAQMERPMGMRLKTQAGDPSSHSGPPAWGKGLEYV
jgi:hypothetical protein